ncbi:MAG TPA: UDP-glucose/GDP-mannose dehydrogenase family protein [Ignavibacteria bacterium]|nr:UDP-glucose/GDP-mannose dehydrogenase family protein [Ignavibacteria bacterium]HMQ99902.1 UDP-glucose/GDP-mannose dehydrogenase family protein [Ignavibacteria bacterium]
MKLGIIGTGYVGLVSGVCFAENGNNVICMDLDSKKIERLKKGDPVIYEPGLEELLQKNIAEGRVEFTTSLKEVVQKTDVIFLCLPTPPYEDGSVDLRHVLDVAGNMAKYINGYKVIVSKSTVPVGTCDEVRKLIASRTKKKFDVVSNPEFLKEGAAVPDFMSPDRVVVGTRSKKAAKIMQELYSSFMRVSERFILMDERSSELTKYAANSMLALRISFMNELANLSGIVKADINNIRRGIGSDPRIGSSFLFPGVGYGGSCFPKDVKGLLNTSKEKGYDFKILKAIDEINNRQKLIMVDKILAHNKNNIKGKTFTVWGLSYKPRTDDLREAPALTIIEKLLSFGAKINAYDPVASDNFKMLYGRKFNQVKIYKDNYSALKNSDGLILVTEWNEFRKLDIEKLKKLMKQRVIFDGRNIYDPKFVRKNGFKYFGIGF